MNVKLIQLLVESLGGWPVDKKFHAFIAQDDDGDLWAFPSKPQLNGKRGDWEIHSGDGCYLFNLPTADDNRQSIITREQYEAALAASKSKWDGDGLPPVGVDVRVTPHNNHWGFSSVGEFSGKVLAFDGEDFWFKLTNGGKIASRTDKVDFRPIRTEQEEKKLSAIDSLVEFKISYHSHPKAAEEYLREMSSLYDAIAAGKIPHIRID